MAVSWKVVSVLPENLQETLEEYTNDRWRVLQVCPSPAQEPTYSPTRFTVVGYRISYEKGNRPGGKDDTETQ